MRASWPAVRPASAAICRSCSTDGRRCAAASGISGLLYAPRPPTRARQRFAAAVRVIAGAGGTRWEQWTLARALARERPDVLFAPGYTAPLTHAVPDRADHSRRLVRGAPGVVLVRAKGARRRVLTAWSARRATARADRLGVLARRDRAPSRHPGGKVRVIPLGMTRPTGAEPARDTREPIDPVCRLDLSPPARRHAH